MTGVLLSFPTISGAGLPNLLPCPSKAFNGAFGGGLYASFVLCDTSIWIGWLYRTLKRLGGARPDWIASSNSRLPGASYACRGPSSMENPSDQNVRRRVWGSASSSGGGPPKRPIKAPRRPPGPLDEVSCWAVTAVGGEAVWSAAEGEGVSSEPRTLPTPRKRSLARVAGSASRERVLLRCS
jgi:hypothetical protein